MAFADSPVQYPTQHSAHNGATVSWGNVVDARDVLLYRGDTTLVGPLSWRVNAGEQWIIFGPNGAGKTSLLRLLTGDLYPSRGTLNVLGEEFGHTDLTELRTRIGVSSAALARHVPAQETVLNVVLSAGYSMLGRWKEEYLPEDLDRATALLEDFSVIHLHDRPFGLLSEGEQKRVLIARALMAVPELLLLDEPTSGLDLGGREDVIELLELLAQDPQAPAMVMVTHHVEEIPRCFTHAMILREGQVVHQCPIADVITSQTMSDAFAQPITVTREDGRFFAHRDYARGRHSMDLSGR